MDKQMITLDGLERMQAELAEAFSAVQMPRTPYALEKFVVGMHIGTEQQYAQCVVELQVKYYNIRRALLHRQTMELDIAQLQDDIKGLKRNPLHNRRAVIRKELEIGARRMDVEEQDLAMLGAWREFQVLYKIWLEFPKHYSRDEINAAQPTYWRNRLTRQANMDLVATGRVGAGNQEALAQIGLSPIPELDHVREVERKYLAEGDIKVLIAVPTEKKAVNGLPCLEGLVIPSGIQVKYYNVFGRAVDEAYNEAVRTCLADGASFLFTVEDDTFPPADALSQLMRHVQGNADKTIVGGWYPKRSEVYEGAPIVLNNGKREALAADGGVHKVYTIPMGCTLFPAEAFLDTVFPWFEATAHLTQDSFFSQKAREAGWTLLCDTSIRCRHIDRDTGRVYE